MMDFDTEGHIQNYSEEILDNQTGHIKFQYEWIVRIDVDLPSIKSPILTSKYVKNLRLFSAIRPSFSEEDDFWYYIYTSEGYHSNIKSISCKVVEIGYGGFRIPFKKHTWPMFEWNLREKSWPRNCFVRHYILDGEYSFHYTFHITMNEPYPKASFASHGITKCLLCKNLPNLYLDRSLSDVTIKVGDEEIPAHKLILKLKSRVFAAMFRHEMRENEKNVVEVNDIEAEVFKEMLRFIYTERVENLKKIADQLLIAAQKYELDKLAVMCVDVLAQQLTVDNAADQMIFADFYNSEELKLHAAKFIESNIDKIYQTEGFQLIINDYPYLMAYVLRALAERRSSTAMTKPFREW